jgi:hypothetical protein
VYTIKELEKSLPGVASINSIQVKEYLQALQDESLIRCEKIGSGNWYWSFTSDAKKNKQKVLNDLKVQEETLAASIADKERQIEEIMAKRQEDDEMLDEGGMDRNALMEAHETLLKEMEGLDKHLALYSDNDPTEVLKKVEDTQKLKNSAIRWSENIESLEAFLVTMNGDRNAVAAAMRHVFSEFLFSPFHSRLLVLQC